jgi:predicted transcriptional regulator
VEVIGDCPLRVRRAPMRSRIEIMAAILGEARLSAAGVRKTRLMYRCNLSFRQLKVYAKLLGEKGFLNLTVSNGSNGDPNGGNGSFEVYRTTGEGLSFLKAYETLKRQLKERQLRR